MREDCSLWTWWWWWTESCCPAQNLWPSHQLCHSRHQQLSRQSGGGHGYHLKPPANFWKCYCLMSVMLNVTDKLKTHLLEFFPCKIVLVLICSILPECWFEIADGVIYALMLMVTLVMCLLITKLGRGILIILDGGLTIINVDIYLLIPPTFAAPQ